MALNREQIEQVLKVLAETSMRPAGGTEYPEEKIGRASCRERV